MHLRGGQTAAADGAARTQHTVCRCRAGCPPRRVRRPRKTSRSRAPDALRAQGGRHDTPALVGGTVLLRGGELQHGGVVVLLAVHVMRWWADIREGPPARKLFVVGEDTRVATSCPWKRRNWPTMWRSVPSTVFRMLRPGSPLPKR
jgi:hypothetical protein